MELFKRLAAGILAAVLCLGLVTFQGLAQENAVDASLENAYTVRGENGFGTLLSEEFQQVQDAEATGYQDGACITDLTFQGSVATVEYWTEKDAVLTVAVYTEDRLQLLASATAEVSPEDEVVEITFSQTLPEYFTATAYLMDSYDFSPLCPSYSTAMYTRTMQDLLKSTTEDYDPELVLNLDADKTTNFAVYAEDAKRIPYREGVNKVVKNDSENHIYVIENADSQITSLEVGDVFSYNFGENEYLIAKVGTISVNGTTVTITGAELELEEVFSHVKVEFDTSRGEPKVDTGNASPYVEFLGVSQPPQTFAWEGGDTASEVFSYRLVEAPTGGDSNIKLSGTVNLTLKADFSFYFSLGHKKVKIELNATLDLSASLIANIDLFKIPLGFWHYGVPGLYIDFTPELVLTLKGRVIVSGGVSFTLGLVYDSKCGGLQKIDKKPVWNITKTEAEATFFFGVDFSPSLEVIDDDVAQITLGATTGLEVKAKLGNSVSLKPKETPAERHSCKACVDINPALTLRVTGKISLLNWDRFTILLNLGSWRRDWEPMYYSIDNRQFGIGKCPYKEYLVTLETKDSDGQPVTATVKTEFGTIWGTTDETGICQIYVKPTKYTLVAETLDKAAKQSIHVPRQTKAVFELQKKTPGGEIEFPGNTPGSGIGGALGKVETEDIVQQEKLIASGRSGASSTWELYDSGNLYVTGKGAADYQIPIAYADMVRQVTVEKGITSLEMFPSCSNLTKVILPDTVTKIGDMAFYQCENLRTLENADQVTEVGENAFFGCVSLSETDIGPKLKTLADSCFRSCSSLNITLPDTLTTIPQFAFSGCKGVGELKFTGKNITIGNGAFSGVETLTCIDFGNANITLGTYAFGDCRNLTDITFGFGDTSIGDLAFADCTGLETVSLPYGTSKLGEYAFTHCESLTKVTVDGMSLAIEKGAFRWCPKLKDVLLRSGVVSIGEEAFYHTDIRNLLMPSRLTSIGARAFQFVHYLERVYFQGNAPSFGADAFGEISNLTAYYPAGDATWTADVMQSYGGNVTWAVSPLSLSESGNAPLTLIDSGPRKTASEAPSVLSIVGGEYGQEETGQRLVNTASFEGLVPGGDYILLVLADAEAEALLASGNLLYIDQAAAETDGTLKFRYLPREITGAYYAFACGPSGKDLKDAVITFPTMYRSESPKAVQPTVTYGGKTLKEGTDYEISGEAGYSSAGSYSCVIRGIYDYTGSVTCSYTVLAGEHDHTGGTPTCKEKAVCTICWEVYGQTDPGNHAGQTEVRNRKAPSCTSNGYTGDTYCLDCTGKIASGQPIPGGHKYENGSCSTCGSPDPNAPSVPTDPTVPAVTGAIRVYGDNRFETAFLVAEQMKQVLGIQKFDTILVASGKDFADALSGSYLAAVKKAPILLSYKQAQNQQAQAYIRENLAPGGRVYILGGTSAVPKSMEDGLAGLDVKRLAGDNRFETNLEILREAGIKEGQEILVCTSTNFADSLSASATGCPILLVYNEKGRLTDSQKTYLGSLSNPKFCIIGGESAVSGKLEDLVNDYGFTDRLAAENRFGTSVAVAKRYFTGPSGAVLAYARNYPDGLCGGPLAYAMGAPLILTMTGYEAQAAEYARNANMEAGTVLGGTGLISDKAVRNIFALPADTSISVK